MYFFWLQNNVGIIYKCSERYVGIFYNRSGKFFGLIYNLEYSGTFTSKLFMHVSSRNMFPTTRNLQMRVHVYRPRHYYGDWLTFGCFVPMIADHNLVKKSFGPMIADHDLVKKR